jgi:NAD binding domain of 6-phosphogluconate dehydrogenase
MASNIKTIGFIGLGNAGYHLAANLPLSGFNLIVRDADSSRAKDFVDKNANSVTADENDEDVWKAVDALVTMLPNGEIVRDVLLGDAGIARNLRPGKNHRIRAKDSWEIQRLVRERWNRIDLCPQERLWSICHPHHLSTRVLSMKNSKGSDYPLSMRQSHKLISTPSAPVKLPSC